ncbi:transposase [Mobiluncus porci]|uniref:Transposase IS200-like domain-containing protein n=1 Tax=Mobiluncus porci TaxID=2652278 RepID=A0A7K0K352_9ACTO|nr:transposase [Mobiluncus porci]MST49849.1 hypothetical protein [Mobiluncus porci]
MARRKRRRGESSIYHVYARGHGKQYLFTEDKDRYYFLKLLRESKATNEVEVLAYCLMDNHFHLMIRDKKFLVSKFMKQIEENFAHYFNKKNDCVGYVFQGRFKSKPVDTEGYLYEVFPYILRNPEDANIARHDQYRWSSYGEYVSSAHIPDSPSDVTDTDFMLKIYGGPAKLAAAVANPSRTKNHVEFNINNRFTDAQATEVITQILKVESTTGLQGISRSQRDKILSEIKAAHVPVNQISRLTGISRNIVQRAKK